MINAIIFDLDNTLIDFTETKNTVIAESVKAMVDAGVSDDVASLLREFSAFYWRTGIEDQHIFQKFLYKKYGKVDYRVLAHAIIAYRRAKGGLLRPYPGARRMLISLKSMGQKLAILSDAPKLEAYIRLCQVGLDDFFDVILTTTDTKKLKPHSHCFLLAVQELGIPSKECLMVGDMPQKDVLGAKRLGMKTVFAAYGHRKPPTHHGADFVAHSVLDIVDIVRKVNKR